MFFFGINLALIMQSFLLLNAGQSMLSHWGPVMHLCVGKLTIIGSDNGLSPGWRQAIIWIIAGILSIGPLGTNFSEILIAIYIFSLKKMQLKMSLYLMKFYQLFEMILFLQLKCIAQSCRAPETSTLIMCDITIFVQSFFNVIINWCVFCHWHLWTSKFQSDCIVLTQLYYISTYWWSSTVRC